MISGWGRPPGEWEMATHSLILAWRIPWAEEPGKMSLIELTEHTQAFALHLLVPNEFESLVWFKSHLDRMGISSCPGVLGWSLLST